MQIRDMKFTETVTASTSHYPWSWEDKEKGLGFSKLRGLEEGSQGTGWRALRRISTGVTPQGLVKGILPSWDSKL